MEFIFLIWPVLILVVLGTIVYQLSKLGTLIVRYLDLKIEYLEKKLDSMDEDKE